MPARKRNFEETLSEHVDPLPTGSSLGRLRSMWQFASLMQYIYFFGEVTKIDKDLDIEELEMECMKPEPSEKLVELGLSLLKFVSSFRGLTHDNFSEYTRRQYVAKAPSRNPFGDPDRPLNYNDLDVFTKIKVLHQLSVWTLNNPDRMRSQMDETESEQLGWRIEPFGWDALERIYILLDDDRLYRRTDPPVPPIGVQKTRPTQKKTKGRRTSKRVKVVDSEADESLADGDGEEASTHAASGDADLDDSIWECIAVTFQEYKGFLEGLRKSRDADEKALVKRVTDEVLPVLERRAEAHERKAAKKQRELEVLNKLATAKRSSRIAGRQEKQKGIEEAEAAGRRRHEDLVMARKEEEKRIKMEGARESRMMTREQRIKDREVRRILHEEELARLAATQTQDDSNHSRISERHRQAEIERRQRELDELNKETDWDFDCAICGVHGKNLDDGTHSIACEKCGVWQHSSCYGFNPAEAEKPEFHFLCAACKKPTIPSGLKIKLHSSSSPRSTQTSSRPSQVHLNDGVPHLYGSYHSLQSAKEKGVSVPPTLEQATAHLNVVVPSNTPKHENSPLSTTAKELDTATVSPLQALPTTIIQAGSQSATQSSPAPEIADVGASTYPVPAVPTLLDHRGFTPYKTSPPSTLTTPATHGPHLHSLGRHRTPSAQSARSVTSPAPAVTLTATQGSTDVQFSPALSQDSPRGGSHFYATTSIQPSASALSPTKHDSLSPTPLRMSPLASGFSPPQSIPAVGMQLPTIRDAPSNFVAVPILPEHQAGVAPILVTPSSPPVNHMPPAPELSPDPAANVRIMAPPMKKQMPESHAQLDRLGEYSL